MRVTAQTVLVAAFCVLASVFATLPAYAQTTTDSYSTSIPTSNNFLFPNAAADVPQNHHTFTQVELIDIVSAAMCQLTGIDPSDPSQPCLGVDPTSGQIGLANTQQQPLAASNSQPAVGGAVAFMTQNISSLFVPAVSTTQYVSYLSDNFGIVKSAYAQAKPTNCNTNPFGYGFCGLSPLLRLWADVRDLSYALLTVLFIAIGIGVMLRFRVDPRTVMTLQNQIPRVIIAIILITFSFGIAGAMIDLMWTVTYAGVNFISQSAPNSKIAVDCPNPPKPINQVAETRLLDQPISFTNTVFRADCNATIDSGLLSLSDKVSGSLGDLVSQLIHDLLLNNGNACHSSWWNIVGDAKCAVQNGALNILIWITEQIVKLIIVIAILIALFRLWFELIKCYLTFLIFVIMGPIWIVLGLVPGRPLGFEKWLRIIFSNLAVFPLVAFILVFARIIVDAVPSGPSTPSTVFVPPLIGNPSIATFSDLMGFGAIMIAPTIPNLIKERMKAKSQSNLGAAVAAGTGMAATAFSAPGRKAWESLNRHNPTTGAPEGALAIRKAKLVRSLPVVGRRVIARDLRRHDAYSAYTSGEGGTVAGMKDYRRRADEIIAARKGKGGGNAEPGAAGGTGGGGGAAPAGGNRTPSGVTPTAGATRRAFRGVAAGVRAWRAGRTPQQPTAAQAAKAKWEAENPNKTYPYAVPAAPPPAPRVGLASAIVRHTASQIFRRRPAENVPVKTVASSTSEGAAPAAAPVKKRRWFQPKPVSSDKIPDSARSRTKKPGDA